MKRLLFCLCLLLAGVTQAQESLLLRLQADTTTLQTGQAYPVTIMLDNVSELWLANIEIEYDPAVLYIIGTASGSPVQPGSLFDATSQIVIGNNVDDSALSYTISQLAPAPPVSGSGSIGSFTIYPLRAGTTRLSFRRAELTRVNFREVDGSTIGESTENLPFTPVLLELTIAGDPAAPPSEASATPTPTYTPDVAVLLEPGSVTREPTLVNATPVPLPTPSPENPAATNDSPLLLLAFGLILAAGFGLIVLARYRRNSARFRGD